MSAQPVIRTHILSIKNADCIIIQLPATDGRKHIGLIDCGNSGYAKRYFNRLGFQPDRIQFIVATHPHRDHIVGLRPMLRYFADKEWDIGGFWDSGYPHGGDTYDDLITEVEKLIPNRLIYPKEDAEPFEFGLVKVHVLSPTKSGEYPGGYINNSSIVLMIEYEGAKLLLGGDAQYASWSKVINGMKSGLVDSNLLKVPHHGSRRGSSYELIHDFITPNVAVITGNRPLGSKCEDEETHCFPH
ncbi:MAG: ComEC/Rec2 family competence protein, partial [Candidatus Hodarchaeota archaeon]